MQELYTLITTAPLFIQILVIILTTLGAYVIYRFRYIVGIIAIGAIALYTSLKTKKKD